MSVLTSTKEYVVYKGESLVCMGTIQECAQHMGVLPKTVWFYTTPSYEKMLAKRKRARNYLTVTELEEDEG
ncbi:hypothetical protein CON65_02490 [Bacillus pseudomycoides]|uniref:Uncharacterized protein n=1 Tax=Bacillus pseudomycoides TaxID=64104 RepID=A0AA91VG98_9BACI|nr:MULTISPECIES: hypothetical protein [Bacillus]PED84322.1 hypothetical protein CON65_02490 [Bacillus pseudomycoides]PEU15849.1 hypothetical protein CN524_06195 [Bacillus sp. AFS019443]PEU19715.1 hypothetical protein CN525_06085 [Bacillus sp. AFS014408]PFW64851.1 hypothetical protein COL20_02365 [Bacillus sp. AFS075034]